METKQNLQGITEIQVKKLKQEIKEQINKLIQLLQKNYLELSKQKGWLKKDQQDNNQISIYTLCHNLEPNKMDVLNKIQKKFLYIQKNQVTQQILNTSYKISLKLNDLPDFMIVNKINEYVQKTSKIGKIFKIKEKVNGAQFGKIIQIQTKKGYKEQFHVKTHQYGLVLIKTNCTVKSVDLKEIFAYKFLELCGIVPQVHFLYDNDKYFYIATKNEGYSQNRNTEFITYSQLKLKKNYQEVIKKNSDLLEFGILMADFYCRLLKLTDVLRNSGNFGFVVKGNQFEDFKIIDFRVPSYDDYHINGIVGGWEAGNGEYNYQDEYIYDLLKTQKDKERVKNKSIKILPFIQKKINIPDFANQACQHILDLGQKVFQNDKNNFSIYKKDLIKYKITVIDHFQELYYAIKNKVLQSQSKFQSKKRKGLDIKRKQ